MLTDLSTETFQARRDWHEIFKVMKNKNLQQRLLYPVRLSFKIEIEIKGFPDKKKLKEFTTTKQNHNKFKGLALRKRNKGT